MPRPTHLLSALAVVLLLASFVNSAAAKGASKRTNPKQLDWNVTKVETVAIDGSTYVQAHVQLVVSGKSGMLATIHSKAAVPSRSGRILPKAKARAVRAAIQAAKDRAAKDVVPKRPGLIAKK